MTQSGGSACSSVEGANGKARESEGEYEPKPGNGEGGTLECFHYV